MNTDGLYLLTLSVVQRNCVILMNENAHYTSWWACCHKLSIRCNFNLITENWWRVLLNSDCSVKFRFGKSTHMSVISNSVAHLRSYTNSAIADIAGNSALISPVTPRDRRAERRRLRIERRRLRIERRYRRIEWRVFHDVSQYFKSVSWCFTSGSRCFTLYHNVLHVFHDVLICLTMFYV